MKCTVENQVHQVVGVDGHYLILNDRAVVDLLTETVKEPGGMVYPVERINCVITQGGLLLNMEVDYSGPELEDCPNCGSDTIEENRYFSDEGEVFQRRCDVCGLAMESYVDQASADNSWNSMAMLLELPKKHE